MSYKLLYKYIRQYHLSSFNGRELYYSVLDEDVKQLVTNDCKYLLEHWINGVLRCVAVATQYEPIKIAYIICNNNQP